MRVTTVQHAQGTWRCVQGVKYVNVNPQAGAGHVRGPAGYAVLARC